MNLDSHHQTKPLNLMGRMLLRLHMDGPLMLLLILICAMGLFVLYSADGSTGGVRVNKQIIRIVMAFAAAIVVAQMPPNFLRLWSPYIFGLGVILLLFVAFTGDVGKGAQRWLDIGIVRFQPSEIMKLSVPMMLAWYLHKKSLPPTFKMILISAIFIAAPTLLILRQPDLGTALLIASSGVFVIYFSGISKRLIFALGLLAAAALPAMWHFVMREYQKQRVLTMFNPESDPLGAGYHIIQSKIAIGSGGLFGKGWLNGTQSQLEFLPERSTDFIFAVLGEEFGLLGLLTLLILYLLVVARGLYIATQAQDTYSRLLAGSLSLTFFVYVFVNTGMVTGLMPVVGLPLPLISYGGTSMVTIMAGFGILMSIHSHRKFMAQ